MSKRISGEKSFTLPTRHVITAGIDVDRDYLVTAIMDRSQVNGSSPNINTVEFEQSRSGIASLVNALIEEKVSYTIIESTGTYHIKGYEAMCEAGLNVGVINPLYVKARRAARSAHRPSPAIQRWPALGQSLLFP